MTRFRLAPSKHDPLSRRLAGAAGWIVGLQWLVLAGFFVWAPLGFRVGPVAWTAATAGFLVLALAGLRGVVSGSRNRMGALSLLTTNALLFFLMVVPVVLELFQPLR